MPVIVILFFLLIDLVLINSIERKNFKWIVLGVLVIIFANELLKFVELGGTLTAYIGWFNHADSDVRVLNGFTSGTTIFGLIK
jgi:hypothetical protein